MSPTSSLAVPRTPRWVWLSVGLILLITLLAIATLPSSRSDDEVGERLPGVRPQSGVRPSPSPAVARARLLAV